MFSWLKQGAVNATDNCRVDQNICCSLLPGSSFLVHQVLWCHAKQKASNEAAGDINVLFDECFDLEEKKENVKNQGFKI